MNFHPVGRHGAEPWVGKTLMYGRALTGRGPGEPARVLICDRDRRGDHNCHWPRISEGLAKSMTGGCVFTLTHIPSVLPPPSLSLSLPLSLFLSLFSPLLFLPILFSPFCFRKRYQTFFLARSHCRPFSTVFRSADVYPVLPVRAYLVCCCRLIHTHRHRSRLRK